MKAVWMIDDGEYSDYHVVGIYSTKKNAETIQTLVGGEVRELPLNPGVESVRLGLSRWHILMLRDGKVEFVGREEINKYSFGLDNAWVWERSKAAGYKGKDIPDVLDYRGWAKTKKQAIKAANEKRAQVIASGVWL